MEEMECKDDPLVNHAHRFGIGANERFDVYGFPGGFPVAWEIVCGRIGVVVQVEKVVAWGVLVVENRNEEEVVEEVVEEEIKKVEG